MRRLLLIPILLFASAVSAQTLNLGVAQPYLNITAPNTIDGVIVNPTTSAAGKFTTVVASGTVTTTGTIAAGTPTIASGCGTPTSVVGGASTFSFVVGATSCAPVLTLPTAPHGWMCWANDITHTADLFVQTATGTTSCTLSATVSASDAVIVHAEAY